MHDTLDAIAQDPTLFGEIPFNEWFHLEPDAIADAQLRGLRNRFSQLKETVLILGLTAKRNGVHEINTLNDIVPALFAHNMYKSYPQRLVQEGNFSALTRWLSGFVSDDLGGVNTGDVDTVDGWLSRLDDQTGLRVLHTFGTTGKLSFLPRTKKQWEVQARIGANCLRNWRGAGSGPDVLTSHRPLVIPAHRHGYCGTHRVLDECVRLWAGGDDNALFLYPDGHFSADLAALAGKGASRGNLDQLSGALRARLAQAAAADGDRASSWDVFSDVSIARFGGEDVVMFAVWPLLCDWLLQPDAPSGPIFGRGTVLMSGGGTKGRVLPPGYRERVLSMLGCPDCFEFYGMSELMVNFPKCEAGRYHIPPVIVPFVLDPETGAPLPREGVRTGQFAAMDLLPDNYWGGIVTGDLVTLDFGDGEACACGRSGAHVHDDIVRITDAADGDKVSCSSANQVYSAASAQIIAESTAQ